MKTLTIVPPGPGFIQRAKPFVTYIESMGWKTEIVQIDWKSEDTLFSQVREQTKEKNVFGFSLGALYSHLGATNATHLILGSISPFFLEDTQEGDERWMISYTEGNKNIPADILVGELEDNDMHVRATAVHKFYKQSTYTVVKGADHELLHKNYLKAIKNILEKLQ